MHWTDEQLNSIGARFVMAGEGMWRAGPFAGFTSRSLGLEEASNGMLGAYQLRPAGGPSVGEWVREGFDFHFFYVLAGSLTLEDEDGSTTTLRQGDAVHHPRGVAYRVTAASPDFDGIEATEPARSATPEGSADTSTEGAQPVYSFDSAEAHVLGAGPRPNVIYRDIGTAAATDGRIRVQVNRAAEPVEHLVIWHYHNMAQWFILLDGWARLEVKGNGSRVLATGDCLTVGGGPDMAHNVATIGEGFKILELCIPADYDTYPIDPPEGEGR